MQYDKLQEGSVIVANGEEELIARNNGEVDELIIGEPTLAGTRWVEQENILFDEAPIDIDDTSVGVPTTSLNTFALIRIFGRGDGTATDVKMTIDDETGQDYDYVEEKAADTFLREDQTEWVLAELDGNRHIAGEWHLYNPRNRPIIQGNAVNARISDGVLRQGVLDASTSASNIQISTEQNVVARVQILSTVYD